MGETSVSDKRKPPIVEYTTRSASGPKSRADRVTGHRPQVGGKPKKSAQHAPSSGARSQPVVQTRRTGSAAASRSSVGAGPPVPAAPVEEAAGAATQFPRSTGSTRTVVVVGLDFGTALTKVVVRTPYVAGGKAFPIPLDSGQGRDDRFLLRSVLYQHGRELSLLRRDGSTRLARIKTKLMREARGGADENAGAAPLPHVAATAYLALVLRRVRGWFLREQSAAFGAHPLEWNLNVGLPAAGYEDDSLRRCYLTVARAAWLLSTRSLAVTVDSAGQALEDVRSEDRIREADGAYHTNAIWLPPELRDLGIYPEVAASVVSFVRSPMRETGLHFLMDVGAGTLDVCGFVLHDDGADHIHVPLGAVVEMLGTNTLQESRVHAIGGAAEALDPAEAIPDRFLDSIARSSAVRDAVEKADVAHSASSRRLLHRVVWAARKRRDPNSSKWRSELPLFVTGGGSSLTVFNIAIADEARWIRTQIEGSRGFRETELPRPASSDVEPDFPYAIFHRLAVAWGLSYPQDDIGVVKFEREVDDIVEPAAVRSQAAYVGKEQT